MIKIPYWIRPYFLWRRPVPLALVILSILPVIFYPFYRHKMQCDFEKAVMNSDVVYVRHSLKSKGRYSKILLNQKIICIDEGKGKTILDLANDRVEYWSKNGNPNKVIQARLVRDAIEAELVSVYGIK